MIWTAGPDGGCDYTNARWLEFTGRRLSDEAGAGWTRSVHPDDREHCLAAYRESFEARRPFTVEYRVRRRDGEYRWLLDTAEPRLGPGGEFVGFVGCRTDVTERRALEHRLAQTQRGEALGRLAGGLAHDFNNLLTGIIGHVALLLEDGSLSPEARHDLAQIRRAADRAALLTRQLLAFSRRQVLTPRLLDLNHLVADLATSVRHLAGSRITLATELEPGLDPVLADPGQLEQVVMQLSANARDAMPQGGRLEIATRRVDLDEAAASARPGLRPGPYVTLTVRDTGVGLAPEDRARVFEPFATGPGGRQATGLGLASVYEIVKQSGGYIDVWSAPGQGSSFTVYFPRRDARLDAAVAAEPPALPVAAPPAPRGDETILLVEDEEQVRDLARRVLQRHGYTVLAAADAESAAALADRHAGDIHLLVTDVVLPRISGRELAARLTIHRPATRVLYISGTRDGSITRHRVLEPGTEFLEKPFPLDLLLRKVRRVLGRPAATARAS